MADALQSMGQPIIILSEGALRTNGKNAQQNNIAAAKAVADAVKTTLGPKGMDKMLVDEMGDIVITNDGVTILEEMKIEHPAAKMLVEVAKTQDKEVGDGTTTAVVLAGALLQKAQNLLDRQIHPTIIIKGFRLARAKALETVEKISLPVNRSQSSLLEGIAKTAMTGKSAENASKELSSIAVEAIRKVATDEGVDVGNVKIEKRGTGSLGETRLIEGVVVDKEIVHPAMPRKVENAKIALLDCALEIKGLEGDAKISIESPEKLEQFFMQEEGMVRNISEKIVASGATVVLCQKGIDDRVQHSLAKAHILAARRVKKSDMELLAKAAGARICSSIKDLSSDDLGYAGLVEERKIAEENMVFVEKCKNPKAVTIFVRAGTEHAADEAQRAMEDAVKGLASAIELGKIVPGGGAAEMELSKEIRSYAEGFKGREQLAILAFADALESIPQGLAQNAGLDPIEKVAGLRASHEKGLQNTGLDVFTGEVIDMVKSGVIEPLKIKTQAIKSAAEVAEMIVRIDDIVSAEKSKAPPASPQMPQY